MEIEQPNVQLFDEVNKNWKRNSGITPEKLRQLKEDMLAMKNKNTATQTI